MKEFVFMLAAVFVAGFIVGVCVMEISDEMMIDDIAEEIEERRSKRTIPVFHPSMRHDVPLT